MGRKKETPPPPPKEPFWSLPKVAGVLVLFVALLVAGFQLGQSSHDLVEVKVDAEAAAVGATDQGDDPAAAFLKWSEEIGIYTPLTLQQFGDMEYGGVAQSDIEVGSPLVTVPCPVLIPQLGWGHPRSDSSQCIDL